MIIPDSEEYISKYDPSEGFSFDEFCDTMIKVDEQYRINAPRRAAERKAFFVSLVDKLGVDWYKKFVEEISKPLI